MIKRISKTVLFVLLLFVVFVILYIISAKIFGKMETEVVDVIDEESDITCYLKSNGVHTDLVLPIKNDQVDWDEFLDRDNTSVTQKSWKYLALGWGDKGFYLNTPTWGDLTVGTACKAAFGLSSTAMHVTYYNHIKTSDRCVEIKLNKTQYERMVAHIKSSFQQENGKPLLIKTEANYGTNDCFYEAMGKYSLFKTCNVWTNNTVKASGIKAGYWTPFSEEVLEIHKLEE